MLFKARKSGKYSSPCRC